MNLIGCEAPRQTLSYKALAGRAQCLPPSGPAIMLRVPCSGQAGRRASVAP